MVIAISADRSGPNPLVASDFGKSGCFVLFGPDGEILERVENPYADSLGDGGIQSAQMLIGRNVDVVITGGIGRNALMILSGAKVRICRSPGRNVAEAVALFLEGRLEAIGSARDAEGKRRRRRRGRHN
ncbi:MAG TPA: NifB/NifX family molybdenum-iron cluster-binding protein [Candidatus Kryptobacter bacterium]|nr:NifB/NifX family molybdenum-iron cluster-binding protein [Candidatus Kryptobacter bacterium]